MNCSSCGAEFPPGAKTCPTCGMPTPAYYSDSGTSSGDATVISSSPGTPSGSPPSYDRTVVAPPWSPLPQTPPTVYGSPPYTPIPTSSGSQDTYSSPPPPPPPYPYGVPQTGSYSFPPSPGPQGQRSRRRSPIGIVVLLLVLVVLLIGGGGLIYYAAIYQPARQHAQATATAIAQVTGTAQAQATAAVENPYTHAGTLVLSDPLRDNSSGHNWDENSNCAFIGGTYHAIAPDPRYNDYCTVNASDVSNFTNFAFEVQLEILKGDAGGIIFRVENTNPNQYYFFYIGQDGSYGLDVQNGQAGPTLAQGSSAAIKQGLNQTNLIAVVAKGASMTVYVNHQSTASITDRTYTHGQIGVYAIVYSHPTEVAFSNMRVWTL